MLTWTYNLLLSLKFKKKTFYYIHVHIMDLPTNKGVNYCKLKIWKRELVNISIN